jgi:hypothetical protein
MVAMTFQSRSRKYRAVARPKPEEQPVISTVFMGRFHWVVDRTATIGCCVRTLNHQKSDILSQESEMFDPLTEVVTLLQPCASVSKVVSGAGTWRIRRTETGQPFYCAILEGGCRLSVTGHPTITLQTSDFVLIPAASDFAMASLEPMADEEPDTVPV